MMKNKWYVAEYEIDGMPAYIAEKKKNPYRRVKWRNVICCGSFVRNKEPVEKVVAALNKRELEK